MDHHFAAGQDEDSLNSRGFGYVTYVPLEPTGRVVRSAPRFPECAVRALSELDLKSFQGRLLRLQAAKQKPAAPEADKAVPQAGRSFRYRRRLGARAPTSAPASGASNCLLSDALKAARQATGLWSCIGLALLEPRSGRRRWTLTWSTPGTCCTSPRTRRRMLPQHSWGWQSRSSSGRMRRAWQ